MRLAKLLVCMAILSAVVAGSASAAVPDPERNSNALTGWEWYHGVSESFITNKINANGERIVSLHVESTSPYRFTVALVHNSGPYARGWYWFYNLSAKKLKSKIGSLNARIIHLERYTAGGKGRFAAVLVKNTGAAAKSWWWYYGLTAKQVNARLKLRVAKGKPPQYARIISLDSYGKGSSRRFAVAMIKNAGVDTTKWWWYYHATPSFIASKLSQHNARLIVLDTDTPGRFNVVLVRNTGSAGRFWVYGFGSETQINDLVTENVARIVDVQSYTAGGKKRFAAVAIDDADPDAARLRGVLRSGWDGGLFGAYLKKVGGAVFTGINQDRIFEPASALKALPHLYAIHEAEVDPSNTNLDSTNVTYNSCPGSPAPFDSGQCAGQTNAKDICPTNSNATATYQSTLRVALQRMMQNSDNRETGAVVDHFGRTTINTYADQHGIGAHTQIRQVFGCGFKNNLRNDWTLTDAGKLYEGVLNGSLIQQSANRDTFFNLMITGGTNAAVNSVVQQEANAQSKGGDASDFESRVVISVKGGSYDVACPAGAPASCVFGYYRSAAGRITLPYKQKMFGRTAIVLRSFVFGYFVNALPIPCSDTKPQCSTLAAADNAFGTMYSETFRGAIRDALKTW